jgi:hypothetical protein
MTGIVTLGKLFFKFFFEGFGEGFGRSSRLCRKVSRRNEQTGGKAASIVSPRPVSGLAGYGASRQENNLAEMVATARRIRRAPPGQNRGGGGSERVRPHLQNRA